MRSIQTGATLIELMVAVVIIGILAAIAVPSYRSYVERSVRSEAQGCLMEAVARAERFFARNDRYPEVIGSLYGSEDKTVRCADEADYRVALNDSATCPTSRCIEVVAEPRSTRAQAGGRLHLRYDPREPPASRETRWRVYAGDKLDW